MNISNRTSIGKFSYLEAKNKKRIKYMITAFFKRIAGIFHKKL